MPSKRVIGAGIAAAAVVAAGVAVTVTQHSGNGAASHSAGSLPGVAAGPIHVESITPAAHTKGVDGAAPITVNFSAAMTARTPKPTLSPSVPGHWVASGHSLMFIPAQAFGPATKITVTVPAGPDGVHSAAGGLLTAGFTEKFTTGHYPQLALSEALASQGYLPMSFTASPTSTSASVNDPAMQTAAGQAYNPPSGTFTWDRGYPRRLHHLWNPNQPNQVLAGAVMAFQSQHGMTIDGKLTPKFWDKLFKAAASGQKNANGYTYAVASKSLPESLTIWHNGHVVLKTLANTGIPVSPTADGNFPVYERFRFQIMRGTNPDGSAYADPVSYVSYFDGGDAVHYFPRGSYGWQQSLGCVELPWDSAKKAYPYLTYGSIVSVVG